MATSGSDGSEGGGAVAKTEEERPKPTGPTVVGKCKWFNVAKGFGFITPTDGSQDVFVHQTVIDMPGFRSLDENEEVEFQFQVSEKGREATFVGGPSGTHCKGSKRRPKPKFRRRTNKCYNCGKQGHHAKDCPLPEQPKLCHRCQSDQHLIADCPQPPETQGSKAAKNGNSDSSDNSGGGGSDSGEEKGGAKQEEHAKEENGHT
ncbi:protein lin-28 homolog isoform X2 [Amphiura filiformis]|uniref:protein lin-28 homolog isoform X2 n=1 Tax=Amphiura filiformis TaxID=82378 RepID=UPI003B21ACAF